MVDADSNNESTGTTLFRLSMTMDQLDPLERELILRGLDTLESLAMRLRVKQLDRKIKAALKPRAKRAAKAAAKPVKRRRRVGPKPNYDVNRLITLRLNEKMTQGELAKRLKVHFDHFSGRKGQCSTRSRSSKYFKVHFREPEPKVLPPARLIKRTNSSDDETVIT
jgi:hypothetical protein